MGFRSSPQLGGVCEEYAAAMSEQAEDILSDALTIMGGETVEDPGHVQYGPLRLTVAPKMNLSSLCWPSHLQDRILLFIFIFDVGGQGGWSPSLLDNGT